LRASDHDPSVGRLKLCGAKPQVCDLKIGKWCATPLPPFSNRETCLASAAVCKKQSNECYKSVSILQTPKCVAYTAACAKDAVYCATGCSSTKCKATTFPK
ncbi:hypothetical protein FRC12_021838, partial [Ceratobasidium sp. 428]